MGPAAVRTLTVGFTTLVIAVVVMLTNPASASAHAVLLGTTPGNWQVLDAPPKQLTLRFNEPVDPDLADIRLVGPHGDEVPGVSKPAHPRGDAKVLAVDVPSGLANGTHTAVYRVISADSHPARGAFTFSVREISGSVALDDPGATGSDTVAVTYGVTRWLGFGGLALLVGSAFFTTVCWPGGQRQRGVRRLFWGGWATLTASTVLGILCYGPYVAGRPLSAVFDLGLLEPTLSSRLGVMLLVRLGLLAALAAAVVVLSRRRPAHVDIWQSGRWLGPGVVLAAGYALALTWGLANHSAAGRLVAVTVAVDAVHLVAMSVWLGGLAVLVGVLLRTGDRDAMQHAVPRFSRVALVCVGTLVVTGSYQAWRAVGTPSALVETRYGWFLLGKLGLVVVLVALGLLARRWVNRHYGADVPAGTRRPRRGPPKPEVRRFQRMVGAEAGLATVVLAVTATLVGIEPARAAVESDSAAAQARARSGPVTVAVPFDAGDGTAGDGQVAVDLAPGKVGPNQIHVVVLDAAGKPLPVPEVRAELRLLGGQAAPLPVQLVDAGPAHYVAQDATLPTPGTWELAVTVRTSDVDEDVLRIPVGVA